MQKLLKSHGGQVENIKLVSMDMSAAFEAGFRQNFPNAEITFDKFHLSQSANKAVDSVRKDERKGHEALKNTRYTLLYGNEDLPIDKGTELDDIIESHPKIGLAYELTEVFRDLYSISDAESAASHLAFWCDKADDSNLVPFQSFAKTIRNHWNGIIAYFKFGKLNNGLHESINTKIQLAKRRARGFANIDNFIHIIYFISSKLKLDYHTIH
ncbi:MAG: ISL3 family transposase [Bacteroidales bacterium]|nr:ISL3 family transposase [Candidatus Colimorpha onthohippi]